MHIHDRRLAAVTANASNLANQLIELNQLRNRVREAELSTQRPRRVGVRKRVRTWGAVSVGGLENSSLRPHHITEI
jgi:hypothetical protein